jgi:hypothetical protein
MSDRRETKETTMKTTFLAATAVLLVLTGAAYAQPAGSDAQVVQRLDVAAPATTNSTLSQYGYDVASGRLPQRPAGVPSYDMRPDGSGLMINGLLPAENWN